MNNDMQKLIEILSGICPDVDFENEKSLIDDGLIESLDIVSIVNEIMGEFENFKKPKKLRTLIVECNDVEEDCDKLYLTTMHNLTKNSSDVLTTISWYKIFDCFEACADACEHVSECVSSIVMKNT